MKLFCYHQAELPDCRYTSRQDVSVISMDELQYAASREDCQTLCDLVSEKLVSLKT